MLKRAISAFRIPVRVCIYCLLAVPAFTQQLQVGLVTKPVIERRLGDGAAVQRRDRESEIKQLFADAGCQADEQRIGRKTENIICTLPGDSADTIIVGGHSDFAERGQGIVDDWTGASLLPSLYEALKFKPRHHTYVFVAFDEEEVGLHGSARYVKTLSKEQKAAITAFVNLECLGLGPTNVWVSRSTPGLVKGLAAVAGSIHDAIHGVNVDRIGDDDTHPFASAHIPVISVHSVTQDTLPILHSTRDRLETVNLTDYYESYKLIAFYLAYLDTAGNGR